MSSRRSASVTPLGSRCSANCSCRTPGCHRGRVFGPHRRRNCRRRAREAVGNATLSDARLATLGNAWQSPSRPYAPVSAALPLCGAHFPRGPIGLTCPGGRIKILRRPAAHSTTRRRYETLPLPSARDARRTARRGLYLEAACSPALGHITPIGSICGRLCPL
jgi:hypothetical protein